MGLARFVSERFQSGCVPVMRQHRACETCHWFSDRRGEIYRTFGPALKGHDGTCGWRPPPAVRPWPSVEPSVRHDDWCSAWGGEKRFAGIDAKEDRPATGVIEGASRALATRGSP